MTDLSKFYLIVQYRKASIMLDPVYYQLPQRSQYIHETLENFQNESIEDNVLNFRLGRGFARVRFWKRISFNSSV